MTFTHKYLTYDNTIVNMLYMFTVKSYRGVKVRMTRLIYVERNQKRPFSSMAGHMKETKKTIFSRSD
jgi:hypothetical protein